LSRPLITVETDLFEHREVKAHFVNPCCFGEDFAAWLIAEISQTNLDFQLSEPIQEDYGWGFWARQREHKFWVAISYVGDGPQESPAQWVISVVPDPGLNLFKRLLHRNKEEALTPLRQSLRKAVTSKPGIRVLATHNNGTQENQEPLEPR
jgi:hypothetical protein